MQRNYSQNGPQNNPLLIEKIIASLSYITASAVGFIWLLVAIFTKNNLRPFLKYHIYQSIFIVLGYFLLSIIVNALGNVLSHIPFLSIVIMQVSYLLNTPLIDHYSLIDIVKYSIVFYLAITSFLGQYSYLPWVSDIIKTNVRNS
jgi:uncharacterized membrane protein